MMDQPKVPIVQYGVENKNIPGDPTGWKMKDCGNVCHWSDSDRYKEFPKFGDTDFEMQDGLRVAAVRQFLSRFASSESSISQYGDIVRDTPEELIVDTNIEMLDVRLIKLKDVSCKDKTSYRNSTRSKRVEKLSEKRMATSESPISREVQNFMMARRMSKGEAPKMPMHRATIQNPQGSENRKSWYKSMRHDSCRTFWVKTTREQRDTIRTEARQPTAELLPLLQQIQEEDRSLTRDYFWEYQRDIAATEDTGVYEHIDKDILIILDKHSGLLLCKFRGLFNFLFGEYEVSKVEEAIRKWTSLPPLPLPETSRHMVDDFIRDTKHPEMDLEKATTLEEIEARHQCVVHYGTWAMKGRWNPDMVWKTVDTQLGRAQPRQVFENWVSLLMPTFTENVLGLGSEVVRFLFSAMAPEEYKECCDVFKALPDLQKMKMSEPTFATLAVLGINSYTQRHIDQNDVNFGFAGLVSLGNYTGGNLCFPQLGLQMPHQPGDSVIFRGSELEHFVSDWTGYRIFLLYTNHQPVRNYAHRIMGKLPPKPNDPWHPERKREEEDGKRAKFFPQSDPNSELYDPCAVDPASPEPEELWEADIHGAGYLGRGDSSSDSASGSGRSIHDKGNLVVALPTPLKKHELDD